ncbi:hypothetical protein REH65_31190 [Saccharopolyspora sp. ID03-671]|uniref:hypothetical protein n=1 Tax=Saccharopolyspora sp. ID03-671 TaxID=3073066 RepID=UPI00325141B0
MNTSTQPDTFDHELTFGPAYSYELFFDTSHPRYVRLPSTPPVSARLGIGDRCGCESCRSEAFYAVSPLCRFWRAGCDACEGRRSCRMRVAPGGPWREEVCRLCEHSWREEVAWFRFALLDRGLAARTLRDEAARRLAITGEEPWPVEIPAHWRDADALTLFRYAVANEDHAQVQQASLDRDDTTELAVAGGVEALARNIQGFRDLAAAYRAHGRHQLTAGDPTEPGRETGSSRGGT